ncbi:unnamed protein product [Citrullus colocynthis]|uniref:Pentatricopeptide repeat-containing protein n=1 Tax=Citrullus colocynthis TaxID=252529 RepID=A0ABP0XWD4_9ROSI
MDVLNFRCLMTPGALGVFLRSLGSVGLVEEANFLFDQVRSMGLCVRNSDSYNCLLEILSKANAIDFIENRLREMKDFGWEVDKYTLTPVLKAYCNAGKFDKALIVYICMKEGGWMAFSKWGEADRAMQFIDRVGDQNLGLNEKTFYALIHGFVKESREDMALKLIEKMLKVDFTPDISIYDVLIGELCKKKAFEKAMALFWKMKLFGIMLDVEILAKLIASSSEERVDVALSLFEDMVQLGCERNQLLYNNLIDALCKSDILEESYKLLRDMKQSRLQPIHFTIIQYLGAYASCLLCCHGWASQDSRSGSCFRDVPRHLMEEKEMKPDSYVSVALIDAFISKHNFFMALHILKETIEKGNIPDPSDKNYVTVRNAIFKLSDDEQTGLGVKSLIEKGSIPTISVSCLRGRS